MTDSQKWGIWIVLAAVIFLVLAFLGDVVIIAALVLLAARVGCVGGVVGLVRFAASAEPRRNGGRLT